MWQGSAKFTKYEEKFGKFCYHKTQKLGKNHNLGAFRVISEIQRAKFGVFVTYIFGGKIWGSDRTFRGKFFGAKPRDLLIWKYPPGSKHFVSFKILFSPYLNSSHLVSSANIDTVGVFRHDFTWSISGPRI